MGGNKKFEIVIDEKLCKGCGLCVYACKRGVLAMAKQMRARGYNSAEAVQPEKCTGCENCLIFCPDLAITVLARTTK